MNIDKEQKKLIKKCLPMNNPIVLDCGACKGHETLFFLKNFTDSFVYSFEPDKKAISKFIKRKKKNEELYKRNILFEYALSDVDGEEDFYVIDGCKGAGSLREPLLLLEPPYNIGNYKIKEKVKVKTKKLDTWYEENDVGKIDFIWSDLQGAEDKMIKGGINLLKNTHFLVLESITVEAYKGLWEIDKIINLLPDFKIIAEFKNEIHIHNVLYLENINFNKV